MRYQGQQHHWQSLSLRLSVEVHSKKTEYTQLPITAVLTTAVKSLYWLAAVLSLKRAMVYLSQKEGVWAVTVLAAAARAKILRCMIDYDTEISREEVFDVIPKADGAKL